MKHPSPASDAKKPNDSDQYFIAKKSV
jgi:hypothetical protein